MLSCALMLAATPQIGSDAKTFYEAIQERISKAKGFSHAYESGPDATDDTIESFYFRSGQFEKFYKNFNEKCDGKFYYKIDVGDVTHRRANPEEKLYIAGMEGIYPDVPPLEVLGVVEEVSQYGWTPLPKVWGLRYKGLNGIEYMLKVDPATRLPVGVSLIDKDYDGTIKVPSPRLQVDVVALASERLRKAKSLLIYRDANNEKHTILVFRDGVAYVEKTSRNSPLMYDPKTKTNRWVGKNKPVSAKSLNLPGFGPFTGRISSPVSGESWLSNGGVGSGAWKTFPSQGVWSEIRYGDESGLPVVAISGGAKSYFGVELDPKIIPPKSVR